MTDFRALCIELTDCLEKADWPLRYRYVFRQWVDIARAALADEPAVPAPPADGDVAELPPRPLLMTPPVHPALERYGITWDGSPDKPLLTRMADGYWTPWHVAADLLQRLSPPQPVPVSELSPVAQAVLDSTMGLAATVREAQAVAAAALRAAADQLPLQPLTRDPADPFEQGLRQGQELSRAELLGIAAELEAT